MIVIYNPLILIEAAIAGGLSFAVTKVAPKLPTTTDTLFFVLFLVSMDLLHRYWLIKTKTSKPGAVDQPITPEKPPADWSWLISLKGAHFLFIPAWVFGLITGVFQFAYIVRGA
jgi:hypothetical protein